MSMIPFFPSLRPSIANYKWLNKTPNNEEADILKYERQHHTWLESMKNAASDINPLGKVLTMIDLESDDEDANDDSDDTDTHEDEDEDTNDRPIANVPERTTMGLYSPTEDVNLNDGVLATLVPL